MHFAKTAHTPMFHGIHVKQALRQAPLYCLGPPHSVGLPKGTCLLPCALLVCYTRNQEPVTCTADSANTYGNTQHYPALACPQHSAIAGPFHHSVISWQYCYTKCISEETRTREVNNDHTALMAEPNCFPAKWVWVTVKAHLSPHYGDWTGKPRYQPAEPFPVSGCITGV